MQAAVHQASETSIIRILSPLLACPSCQSAVGWTGEYLLCGACGTRIDSLADIFDFRPVRIGDIGDFAAHQHARRKPHPGRARSDTAGARTMPSDNAGAALR